jgi:hypothetical protein
MTTRHLMRLWPGRRGGTGRDRRWARLARTLLDIGFWHGVPLEQMREQYRAVAAGDYPFTCEVLADVAFPADGEDLAEGRVEELLHAMAPVLARYGVALGVQRLSASEDEYVLDINGRRCVVLDADDWRYNAPWYEATVRPLAVVNDLLARAGSPTRVFTLYAGDNGGIALLLDPAVVDAVRHAGLLDQRDLPALPVVDS